MTRWQLQQALRALNRGDIIAYPTEAIYGLGCDPYNAAAVIDLLYLKSRPLDKGLILIASELSQLQPFMGPLSKTMQARLDKSWPGPTTWLVPAAASTPYWLCGAHSSVAVRVTNHPVAASLCQAAGQAIVSTSANLSGKRPAKTRLRVQSYFHGHIQHILGGKTGAGSRPTEIRDVCTGQIIRAA
ncbi:MAG TPA: tRNA threonylcarbamoyladenosine biosynthesis protein RimN [Gammaproteobacteria bacterium]|nr:tRNA threonylcarbamoyladenosine biosynthesis protein RimN [Gammaproteobacteria bacterium]